MIGAFTVLHVVFYIHLTYHWKRIQKPITKEAKVSFSVIIPVRNESKNIENILSCLENQSYPKEQYEVLIVDDFSEDDTVEKVKEIAQSMNLSIQLIGLQDASCQGKKYALTEGVKQSKYDHIITTDADCKMGTNWLKSYNDIFDQDLNMVAGPVSIVGNGLFGRLQQVEFAGLIGFGAVTLQEENPSMCSGANLGFKKDAFKAVGGYENNFFIPSGDDEFLLYNIMKKFPHSTKFLKDNGAVVHTACHTKLSSFINQRTRWTSKWKYNRNWKVRFAAVLFFLDYLFLFMALILMGMGKVNSYFMTIVLLLRFGSLFCLFHPLIVFLKVRIVYFLSLFCK